MNMSEVINDIKLSNGLDTLALPFKKPVEIIIHEALQISIRTFSRFKPILKEGILPIKQLQSPSELDKLRGIYRLPPELTTTPVQDAFVTLDTSEVRVCSFSTGVPFIGFGINGSSKIAIVDSINTGSAANKYLSVVTRTPTSKWLGSNKIQLFDFPDDAWLCIQVKCNHDENGETIEESCVESFMELGNLDVQNVLYNSLKNHINVGGAFKDIQLKIDDWAGAAQARKELIHKWDETSNCGDINLWEFF